MGGSFIVVEGWDGTGKSSVVHKLKQHLGDDYVFVRDPGGTNIGQQIRKVLLDTENKKMEPLTELFLYVASRAQLLGEVIVPALKAGKTIISDRWTLSTFVYQGITGRGVWNDEVLRRIIQEGHPIEPDCLILLSAPLEVTLARVGKDKDRMEAKGCEFFERIVERYRATADTFYECGATWVDSTVALEEVVDRVLKVIAEPTT